MNSGTSNSLLKLCLIGQPKPEDTSAAGTVGAQLILNEGFDGSSTISVLAISSFQ